MIQLTLVYIIIGSAIVYTVLSVVKTLKTKTQDVCGGDCSCTAKTEIRKALNLEKIQSVKLSS